MNGRCRHRCAGYTLTEMLIAAALLAAAAAVAVPMLRAPTPSRVQLAGTQLVQAHPVSRAVKLNAPKFLTACGSTPPPSARSCFGSTLSTMPPTRLFTVRHPGHHGLYLLDFPAEAATRGVQITAAALVVRGRLQRGARPGVRRARLAEMLEAR